MGLSHWILMMKYLSGITHLFCYFCVHFLWHALNFNSMNESNKSALVELLVLMHFFIATISLGCHSQEPPCTSFQQAEDKRRASTSLHRLFATECCWQCRNNAGAKAETLCLFICCFSSWRNDMHSGAQQHSGLKECCHLFFLSQAHTHTYSYTHTGSLPLCFLHVGGCFAYWRL